MGQKTIFFIIVILISLTVKGLSFSIKYNNDEENTKEKHMRMLTHKELDIMQQVQNSITLIGNGCKDTKALPISVDGFGNFMLECNPYPSKISIVKSHGNYIPTNDTDDSKDGEYPLALLKIQTKESGWSTKVMKNGNIMIKGPISHTKDSTYWIYKPENGKLLFHSPKETISFRKFKQLKVKNEN